MAFICVNHRTTAIAAVKNSDVYVPRYVVCVISDFFTTFTTERTRFQSFSHCLYTSVAMFAIMTGGTLMPQTYCGDSWPKS